MLFVSLVLVLFVVAFWIPFCYWGDFTTCVTSVTGWYVGFWVVTGVNCPGATVTTFKWVCSDGLVSCLFLYGSYALFLC